MEIEHAKSSEACLLVGTSLIQSVNGIAGMIRGLSEGVGPTADKISDFSVLFKMIIKSCEFFVLAVDVQDEPKDKGNIQFKTTTKLRGRAALQHRFKDVENAQAIRGAQSLSVCASKIHRAR